MNTEQKRNPCDEIRISRLGPPCEYSYFPEDRTYTDLLTEVASMNDRNLMKMIKAAFAKNYHFVFWGQSEEPILSELERSNLLATDVGRIKF
jgi:hypothetical protein